MVSKLIEKIQKTKAPICVGLDPMLGYIPEHVKEKAFAEFGETLEGAAEAIWQFNCAIVDATADLIPAVKPQIAMYEQFGIEGLKAYDRTVKYCQQKGLIVIGDIKRGDIGSTSAAYATGHLGSVKVGNTTCSAFNTEYVTVNPYLGTDGVKPFVDECNASDRGIFVLVKTSNPSSGEFQDRLVDGRPLYELVAEKVVEWGEASMDGDYSNVGAVVGATYPEMSKILRKLMPKTYFLVPGYGAQGGTAEDLKYCFNEDGLGAVVNSSRGIIAAYKKDAYAKFGPEHFGERLKAVIGKQSVASFARDCGVSEASMRKYLKTGTEPGIDSVAMIAACTGRSLTWLITGEGDPFTDNAKQEHFSEEDIKKWWGLIFDALDVENKTKIIHAFQQGGLSSVFHPSLATSKAVKIKG